MDYTVKKLQTLKNLCESRLAVIHFQIRNDSAKIWISAKDRATEFENLRQVYDEFESALNRIAELEEAVRLAGTAPLAVRPSVAAFAKAMEEKLKMNDYKGGWEDCTMQYLSMRLTQERRELRRAVAHGDPVRILREAADVANFAMMIAENAAAKIPGRSHED